MSDDRRRTSAQARTLNRQKRKRPGESSRLRAERTFRHAHGERERCALDRAHTPLTPAGAEQDGHRPCAPNAAASDAQMEE